MSSLALYVQVPFCASKCTFCNFSSRVASSSIFTRYAEAIEQEVRGLSAAFEAHGLDPEVLSFPLDTLYFGGGTPALLAAERLAALVRSLRGRFRVNSIPEFTLEATPGSADAAFLAEALKLGINRLSIGAQTFEDRELRSVGRLHSADATRALVRTARSLGFRNISLDLIAGLPFQTETSWRSNLEAALALEPEHISLYLFEIDEKSRLGREVLEGGTRYSAAAVPSEAFVVDAYGTGQEVLAAAGYLQYEISNFALPGFASRHNLVYWRLAPYLGLGAGAHSFDGAHRWANEQDPGRYMDILAAGLSPLESVRSLSSLEQLEEFFFLGLRQVEGVSLAEARNRWGADLLRPWQPKIDALAHAGLLDLAGDNIRLAQTAYLVSNEVFQEFV